MNWNFIFVLHPKKDFTPGTSSSLPVPHSRELISEVGMLVEEHIDGEPENAQQVSNLPLQSEVRITEVGEKE